MNETHSANQCLDYITNKGDCNYDYSYQYCDASYRLRDSKIDFGNFPAIVMKFNLEQKLHLSNGNFSENVQ